MPSDTDKDPAEIRALYVETIAKVFYEAEAGDEKATTGIVWPSWDRLDKSETHRVIQDARLAVTALAEAGLLPTDRESRCIGRGMQRRWRYVGDWHDPDPPEADAGGQTRQMPPRPRLSGGTEVIG